jgi:hypothetical protein
VEEIQKKLGIIRDKYQRLLISIEALDSSLNQDLPQFDERTLKEAVSHIFGLARDIAEELQDFELRKS